MRFQKTSGKPTRPHWRLMEVTGWYMLKPYAQFCYFNIVFEGISTRKAIFTARVADCTGMLDFQLWEVLTVLWSKRLPSHSCPIIPSPFCLSSSSGEAFRSCLFCPKTFTPWTWIGIQMSPWLSEFGGSESPHQGWRLDWQDTLWCWVIWWDLFKSFSSGVSTLYGTLQCRRDKGIDVVAVTGQWLLFL